MIHKDISLKHKISSRIAHQAVRYRLPHQDLVIPHLPHHEADAEEEENAQIWVTERHRLMSDLLQVRWLICKNVRYSKKTKIHEIFSVSVAKRGRPRKNVPIAASPMVPGGNFPPPSPLSRPPGMISQSGPPTLQPYPPMPMNYPGNQPMASSAYGMHNQQQFNQPYPPQRLPYPQPPQPSHQMYSMQMQQMNQNFLSPGAIF